MCAITGLYAFAPSAPAPRPEDCAAIRDAMACRGPDGEGLYRDPGGRLVLGHRRLSIIDLSDSAAQPMSSADGGTWIVFNGEIYNHGELREAAERQGRRFRTRSDTEVLLDLYAQEGASMVGRLRGMFAFAVWDRLARALTLARDPHGVKPLYYASDGGTFRFASSVRALAGNGGVSRAVDPEGLLGFLAWGSVPEPRTLFRGVQALPAGCTLRVEEGRAGPPRRYWSVADVYAPAPERIAPGEVDRRVERAVAESVRLHLVSDVPVGAFLSGGVDSGALVGLAAAVQREPIRTVTLAFEEFRGRADDESPDAEAVARLYGTSHTTVTASRTDAVSGLDDFLRAMDQPSVDGLNVYWASWAVRQAGLKVALSGLGGDELFGGYPSFRSYPLLRRAAPLARVPGAGFLISGLARAVAPRRREKARALDRALARPESSYHLVRGLFTPGEIRRLLAPELWEAGGGEAAIELPVTEALFPFPAGTWAEVATAEQSLYMRNQLLRDADWASMAHSLEVRVPLVSAPLTEEIGPMLAAWRGRLGKAPLARAPRPPLPERILRRPKTGFTLPLQRWIGDGWSAERPPELPRWLLARDGTRAVAGLFEGVAGGRVHWSRAWAWVVLETLVREVA
jgi:asparagine synthase (glutamine-hydrolysing)